MSDLHPSIVDAEVNARMRDIIYGVAEVFDAESRDHDRGHRIAAHAKMFREIMEKVYGLKPITPAPEPEPLPDKPYKLRDNRNGTYSDLTGRLWRRAGGTSTAEFEPIPPPFKPAAPTPDATAKAGEKTGDKIVSLRDAICICLERADLCDMGPPGHGWQSEKMVQVREVLEAFAKGDELNRIAAEARAQGRREGMEEAIAAVKSVPTGQYQYEGYLARRAVVDAIRAAAKEKAGGTDSPKG